MNNTNPHRVKAGVIAACVAMTCAGCAFTLREEPRLPSRVVSGLPTLKVAQTDYGHYARFETCVGASCALPTPKTLAYESISALAAPVLTAPVSHAPVATANAIPSALPSAAAPTPSSEPRAQDFRVTLAIPAGFSGTQAMSQNAPSPAPRFSQPASPVPPSTQVAAAPPALSSAQAADDDEQRVTINFAFSGTELTPAAKATILKAIPAVRSSRRVIIAGRTDSVGDTNVNQAIALRRAISVRDYIKAVAPDAADAIGIDARGDCCFVASNTTHEGRQQNRRVEIVMRGKVDA
jgi:outer membrane protein OmpA-like peptidoglycan-associated protein